MKKLYTIIGEAPISCCVITCILHAEFVEVCVLCMRDRCKYRSKDSRLCFCRTKRRRTRARPRHTIYRKSVLSRLISYFSTRFFFSLPVSHRQIFILRKNEPSSLPCYTDARVDSGNLFFSLAFFLLAAGSSPNKWRGTKRNACIYVKTRRKNIKREEGGGLSFVCHDISCWSIAFQLLACYEMEREKTKVMGEPCCRKIYMYRLQLMV